MKAQHIVAWVAHHNLAFVTETDPAGVGVMKMSAVIDEESDSLIKVNYGGRCYLSPAELFKNFVP